MIIARRKICMRYRIQSLAVGIFLGTGLKPTHSNTRANQYNLIINPCPGDSREVSDYPHFNSLCQVPERKAVCTI